jgi:hypothetical protein
VRAFVKKLSKKNAKALIHSPNVRKIQRKTKRYTNDNKMNRYPPFSTSILKLLFMTGYCLTCVFNGYARTPYSDPGVHFNLSDKQGSGSWWENNRSEGISFYPTLLEFKGFKGLSGVDRTLGFEFVYSRSDDKDSSQNLILTWAKPKLDSPWDMMKMDYWELAYEGRQYTSETMFTSLKFGLKNFAPSSRFKSWYAAKNESMYNGWKPYLSIGMGMRYSQALPYINVPPTLQLDYIIGDDYRFPSTSPNGNNKIPLKGFRLGIGFRF